MKQNKIFIGIFLVLIYGILLLYPVNYMLEKLGYVKISNLSNKVNVVKPGKINYLNNKLKSLEVRLENKVINYFPFYDGLNSLNKKSQSIMNKHLYKLIGKEYYPVGTNNDGEYLFRNDNHFIITNNKSDSELKKRLNNQLDFFNSLDSNLNIYLSMSYRYEYLDDSYTLGNINYYRDHFKNNLSENIKVSEFIPSKDNYLDYFYRTDHHYNMYGAYENYNNIADMMNLKKVNGTVKEEEINYYGSMAKSAYLTDIKDSFYTLDTDILEHDVLVDGKTNSLYKPKVFGENKHIFYDQYVRYYNGMYGMVEHNYHNDQLGNLLIFEDSYGWQIDELISRNYNKTYIIDLRYVSSDFDLNKFTKENNIEDVLFLYEAGSILFDQYDYQFSKVVK